MAANLSSHLYADEAQCIAELTNSLNWDAQRAQRIEEKAQSLILRVRDSKRKRGELESFLQQYGLNTEEGLALMTLAEALLRIPDAATANALIRDKMAAADWLGSRGGSQDIAVKAAGIGLSLTRRTLDSAVGRLGEPVIRKAVGEAIRMLGRQFVLGRTIEEGIKNAQPYAKKGYRMSYDMLGEGARTEEAAERYFETYRAALAAIAKQADKGALRSGMSVKLSALHPRYEAGQEERCVPALAEKLAVLAHFAAANDIPLTVDAEEADRLELSLQIVAQAVADPGLDGWDGFGIAIQAYQKRAPLVIDRMTDLAQTLRRRFQLRLVKGAYWDSEIKRAQTMGLPDYPVFTRKANTDLSYLACAAKMLARRDIFYPMFATHNAHTLAAILDLAGNDGGGFEFQRLHGMGETLHDRMLEEGRAETCIYAPCGSHEELLPYLVRRLLENGASTSFVHRLLDERVPAAAIAADPVAESASRPDGRHPKIPLPQSLYGPARANSHGTDLTEPSLSAPLLAAMKQAVDNRRFTAAPLICGQEMKEGRKVEILSPAERGRLIGTAIFAGPALVEKAFAAAREGFAAWSATPAPQRAEKLEKLADLLEQNRAGLMGLCVREAGKTVPDALSELREAVDFCRYYAMRGRADFAPEGQTMPGPTGESNILTLQGRGVFVCISPWNFPLAIFTGQIAAALMAGNAVIAKPAEQTPLVAAKAAELILAAGIPPAAFTLLPGDGETGAALVAHRDVAGVAFTGSTEVARLINRALAAKDGPIVPLIAETGGQNAMIVDSSSLSEQVIDDVLTGAFGAAGQRCSALRVLYVQDDIADNVIAMLKGAMKLRRLGDPMDLSTDIGPVIDEDARRTLRDHRARMERSAKFVAAVPARDGLEDQGTFFPPVAFEIPGIGELEREIFGPVLHIVRYRAADLDKVIAAINNSGYGLTMGIHSRIRSRADSLAAAGAAGNIYVNRTMTGAVVGVQPFGGRGLSGTGPKAGGPHYLPRFATEKLVATDTTRQGGNAALVTMEEE